MQPGAFPPPKAKGSTSIVSSAHARSVEDCSTSLEVDPKNGLQAAEAARRLQRYGANQLREARGRPLWVILVAQLKSLIVALLLGAAVLSFLWGHVVEGAAVLVVVLVNTALGFFTELRAVRSMEALRSLGDVQTTVRRDGTLMRIAATELVPGDVLVLEAGDRVTADARLVEASRLAVDESTLTGESVPVDKSPSVLPEDTPLADRHNMLFKGTSITRGVAEAVVVGTGQATQLGEIAQLVEEIEDETTPLEKRLEALARQLLWVSLGFAGIIGLTGVASGRDLFVIVETAIALAVATVPEGLPVVATLALARGMHRMAKRNALVDALAAVEGLGSASLIISDKTGTLTQNQMTAVQLVVEGADVDLSSARLDSVLPRPARDALVVAALCNDATLDGTGGSEQETQGALGDPMEVALLSAAAKAGLDRAQLVAELPEVRQEAFDPGLKMMATVHRKHEGFLYAIKGAAESVLQACTHARSEAEDRLLDDGARTAWLSLNDRLAANGRRVLALAERTAASKGEPAYRDLVFLGLIALQDPPRIEVRETVERCRAAGIRLVMATGDQAPTAASIARAVGLVSTEPRVVQGRELEGLEATSSAGLERVLEADVVARATPKHKLVLLSAHQQAGQVVAMLGDGVNDAPALEKADIGVAMGKRGTQVAQEAADMVLLDDRLDTIVAAIEQGRVIFDNIRTFVIYLLSCNLSEILIIGLASLVDAPLPLLPLQILFLNLVTDVFPALALAAGEGHPQIMLRAPRPRSEAILTPRSWRSLLWYAALLTSVVLGAFAIALGPLAYDEPRAVTVAFLTLGFAQLTHVWSLSSPASGLLVNEITRNRLMWGALALCTVLLLAATYAPGLAGILRCVDPGPRGWALIVTSSFIPPVAVHAVRWLRGERRAIVRRGGARATSPPVTDG